MTAIASTAASHPVVQNALPVLMAQATHDLNNQLTTILGQSELALMVDDTARWKRSLEDIQRAGRVAQRLVADVQKLLTWSLPHQDPVQLRDVIELVQRLVARRADQHSVKLTIDGDVSHPMREGSAELALSLWFLFNHVFSQGAGAPAIWTVSLEQDEAGFTRVTLSTPGTPWDEDAVRAAERTQRVGTSLPLNALEHAYACLQAIGARASASDCSFYVELCR
jgi:signal transduction histidine kinase